MKKLNVTKREILFFFLGICTMTLVVIIWEWDDFKRGFATGCKTEIEVSKCTYNSNK